MSQGRKGAVLLTSKDLALLEGVSRGMIDWACRRGIYTLSRKVKSSGKHHGGGLKGQRWEIRLDDPAITKTARERYYTTKIILDDIARLENKIDVLFAEINEQLVAMRKELQA